MQPTQGTFLGITPVSSVNNGLYFLTLPQVSVMCVIYTSKGMSKKFGVRVIYRKIRYIERNLCVTLVIYQESLHDARSTKCKILYYVRLTWFGGQYSRSAFFFKSTLFQSWRLIVFFVCLIAKSHCQTLFTVG